MGVIPFEKVFETVRFFSPLERMNLVEVEIERRRDPLSGRCAITSSSLKDKGSMFFGRTDTELIARLAEESRAGCFFCPERVLQATPRYPESWLQGGLIQVGECTLFPNLFPLSALHAVVALGRAHVRALDQFPADLLRDGLEAGLRFLRSVRRSERRAEAARQYATINANYLLPAGASLVHPHLQLFGGHYPPTAVEQLMADCDRFQQRHQEHFFELLLREEQEAGERYAGRSGPAHWLAPFAPCGANEVLGILEGYSDLLSLDQAALDGLAGGLSRVLACYHGLGFSTFNFSLLAGPLGETGPFPVLLRVICRQNVYANYRADDYFVQKLLGEEIMLITPEELGAELRPFFAAGE